MEEQSVYIVNEAKTDKHEWFGVIRQMQSKAQSIEGFAVITTSILCDSDGKPKIWLPPIRTVIYPKRAQYEFLCFMEEYNILRSASEDDDIPIKEYKYKIQCKPDDIKYDEWIYIIYDICKLLEDVTGYSIVTITVMCDSNGQPKAWPDPIVMGITRENASEKLMRFFENHNVMRRRYAS